MAAISLGIAAFGACSDHPENSGNDGSVCVGVDLTEKISSSPRDVMVTEDEDGTRIQVKTRCVHLTGVTTGAVRLTNPGNRDIRVELDDVTISNGLLKLKTKEMCNGNVFTLYLIGSSSIAGNATAATSKVLSCETNLVIDGEAGATLDVTAHYKTGIGVDDVLTIQGGRVAVTVDRPSSDSVKDKGTGIKAVNGFVMNGGHLTVTARDNITLYEARGIKVDGFDYPVTNHDDADYDSDWDVDACKSGYGKNKGYVRIHGGTIVIDSDGKGLQAGFEAEEDGRTPQTTDDPVPMVEISGGSLAITTHGMPRSRKEGDCVSTDTCFAPEGIEGKHGVTISGGEVRVTAMDDALNASKKVEITGGKSTLISLYGDGIDTNGSIGISGGLTATFGSVSSESGIDANDGFHVLYVGGTLIGLGDVNDYPMNVVHGSYLTSEILLSGHKPGHSADGRSELAGKTIALTAFDDTMALGAIRIPENYRGGNQIVFYSEKLSKGESYHLYTDARVTPAQDSSWFDEMILDSTGSVAGEAPQRVVAGLE